MRDMKESSENYLETILILSKKLERVRSVDIANELGFAKPSISVAMKKLKARDCIEIDRRGSITLTKKGMEIATNVYARHTLLTDVFLKLGVSEEVAIADACKIEHFLSQETVDRIREHAEKMKDE